MVEIRRSEEVPHDFNPTLASFAQNVRAIESWLKTANEELEKQDPDPRKIRMFSQDIPPVLAEATVQYRSSTDTQLRNRLDSLTPELHAYVRRADEFLKSVDRRNREPASTGAGPVDSGANRPHDGSMNSVTTELLNSRLENVELRMGERVAQISEDIRSINNQLQGAKEAADLRAELDKQTTNAHLKASDARLKNIEDLLTETTKSVSGLRTTMILTAVSTVLTIVLGVAAFNATLLSNMLASFESGKNSAAAQADVRRQVEETAVLLRQMQKQMDEKSTSTSTQNK